jgi:hypothetical protein
MENPIFGTFYLPETGQIVGRMEARLSDMEASKPSGSLIYPGAWTAEDYYIVAGKHTLRPRLDPPVVSGKTMTFKLAVVCRLIIYDPDGQKTEVEDDEITLTLEDVGLYRWRIEPPFPFIEASGEITIGN